MPVTAIIFASLFFRAVTVAFSSAVSPLLEIAITISPGLTCPEEPCTASVPFNSYVGVPVEDKSDAIYPATCPGFPIPVICTLFPLFSALSIRFIAFS